MSDEAIIAATGLPAKWVHAIRAVESSGIPSCVRFEPHVFDRLHAGVVVRLDPATASEAQRAALRAQGKVPFTPDPARHISLVHSETSREAFEFARRIDAEAAVRATSWGAFQVLGGHLLALFSGCDANGAVAQFDEAPAAVGDELLVHWLRGNPHALDAAERGDVDGWIARWNGSAAGTPQHAHYAARMRAALGAAA